MRSREGFFHTAAVVVRNAIGGEGAVGGCRDIRNSAEGRLHGRTIVLGWAIRTSDLRGSSASMSPFRHQEDEKTALPSSVRSSWRQSVTRGVLCGTDERKRICCFGIMVLVFKRRALLLRRVRYASDAFWRIGRRIGAGFAFGSLRAVPGPFFLSARAGAGGECPRP